MKDVKKLNCYKRSTNKQLLQLSGLCGTPFLTNLLKSLTQIYRAQYGDAMLVSHRGTPIWRPDVQENIWTSLLLWKRLRFASEQVYFHLNKSHNTWNVQTSTNRKEMPFSKQYSFVTAPSWCHLRRRPRKLKLLHFKNERNYWAENM